MAQYNRNGAPEQHHIQPHAPVMDIPAVHLDALGIVDIASSAGLPHAGDAGEDGVVLLDIFPIPRDFFLDDGAGSDEAHFAFEDVQKLGQFVEAGLSKEGTALGDAGIVFQLEFFIPFRFSRRVGSQEVLQYFLRVYAHGAEFIAVEFFPVFPYPPMLENDGARGVVIDPDSNGQKDGGYEDAAADGGGEVEETLGDLIRCASEVIPDLQHHDLRIEEGLGGHIRHGDGDEVRHDAYIPHEGLCLIDEGRELGLWDAGSGDDDMLDAGITNDALHVTKSAKDGAGLVVRLMVFEKADDAVAHAGIILYLACHDFAGLSCPDDEDRDLEGFRFLHPFCQNDAEEAEQGKGERGIEDDVETGYVPCHLRKEHEDDGEDGATQGGSEQFFHHLVDEHALPIESLIEDKGHVDQRYPEILVDGGDVIGGVGDQEVSNGKGKYPRQDESDVVTNEVEKCGAGCAGNGMVVFRVVHIVVYPSCLEKWQTADVRFQTSDS